MGVSRSGMDAKQNPKCSADGSTRQNESVHTSTRGNLSSIDEQCEGTEVLEAGKWVPKSGMDAKQNPKDSAHGSTQQNGAAHTSTRGNRGFADDRGEGTEVLVGDRWVSRSGMDAKQNPKCSGDGSTRQNGSVHTSTPGNLSSINEQYEGTEVLEAGEWVPKSGIYAKQNPKDSAHGSIQRNGSAHTSTRGNRYFADDRGEGTEVLVGDRWVSRSGMDANQNPKCSGDGSTRQNGSVHTSTPGNLSSINEQYEG